MVPQHVAALPQQGEKALETKLARPVDVQIREVLLHAGVYAGAPAAVEGFRVARAVLLEMGINLAEEPPAA